MIMNISLIAVISLYILSIIPSCQSFSPVKVVTSSLNTFPLFVRANPKDYYYSSLSWKEYGQLLDNKYPFRKDASSSCVLLRLSSSSSDRLNFSDNDQNKTYINGLLQNLSAALDRWIVTGSLNTRTRAYNIMQQIQREAMDTEQVNQASRMISRAGMPADMPPTLPKEQQPETQNSLSSTKSPPSNKKAHIIELGRDPSTLGRKSEADIRKEWELKRSTTSESDIDGKNKLNDPFEFAQDKKALHADMMEETNGTKSSATTNDDAKVPLINSTLSKSSSSSKEEQDQIAASLASDLIAKAGSGTAFSGETLGIGGLDDVLSQIKRRVWVPLAAPPHLLKELGIRPVRGLLLYGSPGCGKTLLARSLGRILSPARPITVVSGPEIMDRYVGSSESNLRKIFDNPPDIYDTFRINTKDNGKSLSNAALHVIIFDEFDAMSRARGGSGGKGDQGDAGVARDSVVNQLLAKMDGIDEPVVPTLVIGLTNRRTLIEPALLRPGRFEVQLEVPKPKTIAQRVSIMNVHMKNMFQAGRLYVSDAPGHTAAARRIEKNIDGTLPPSYEELLESIAVKCDAFSGAALAGVARAAASRALERAVCDFAGQFVENIEMNNVSIDDCLVTQTDFEAAVDDVFNSLKGGDGDEDNSTDDDPSNTYKQ